MDTPTLVKKISSEDTSKTYIKNIQQVEWITFHSINWFHSESTRIHSQGYKYPKAKAS